MRPTAARLDRLPVVAFGPEADGARSGRYGLLLGARRPHWIDVVHFDGFDGPLGGLLSRRFGAQETWEAVGIALSEAEARAQKGRLLEDLVPGDVLATERSVRVHAGDRWSVARGPGL